MNLETFEDLWLKRDQLDTQQREELEKWKSSHNDGKNYAETGWWVRSLLKDIPMEKAPNDFAYRMRVYAANHPESIRPEPERSWLRWPVVTVGAAAGVTAAFLAFGPFVNEEAAVSPTMLDAPVAEEKAPAMEMRAVGIPEADLMIAESQDSSAVDSSKIPQRGEQPDWDMRAVSSGNE